MDKTKLAKCRVDPSSLNCLQTDFYPNLLAIISCKHSIKDWGDSTFAAVFRRAAGIQGARDAALRMNGCRAA